MSPRKEKPALPPLEEATPDLSVVTPQTHGGSYENGRRLDDRPPEVTDE